MEYWECPSILWSANDHEIPESGGAGEFHPHAPTDPCVNLSIHTAPLIQLMAYTPATLLYAQVPPISG